MDLCIHKPSIFSRNYHISDRSIMCIHMQIHLFGLLSHLLGLLMGCNESGNFHWQKKALYTGRKVLVLKEDMVSTMVINSYELKTMNFSLLYYTRRSKPCYLNIFHPYNV